MLSIKLSIVIFHCSKPYHLRKPKVAEAPVTTEELEEMSDPLDFLAKYCIIK